MEILSALPLHGPRERLASAGVHALSDAELLALVLGTGTAREPVSRLAQRLVDDHQGLAGLARLGLGELAAIDGLGFGKASRLVGAIELGRRTLSRPLVRGMPITSSRDVATAVAPGLVALDVEQFVAIPVDARNRALAQIRIGQGGPTYCPVSPGEVFRAVLREVGTGLVVVHNHPSGDPTPSPEDLALTDRLASAGETLGIKLLDHVIVARDGIFSFLDAGLLHARW